MRLGQPGASSHVGREDSPADRLLHHRHECKYFVPVGLIASIRSYLRPFVRPDRHAQHRPGYQYPICSLYLDTHSYALLNEGVRGLKNRVKLRIRTYDDQPEGPVFFEVKRRMNGLVYKHRAALARPAAMKFMQRLWNVAPTATLPSASDLNKFRHLTRERDAAPVVKVKYRREAYESASRDPVRITFDTDLQRAVTRDLDLSHGPGHWQPCALEGQILEIKFTNTYPSWVADLVRHFELQRRSISKYAHSLRDQVDHRGCASGQLATSLRHLRRA